MIFVDYPMADFSAPKKRKLSFYVKGDSRISCRMAIVSGNKKKLPAFTVKVNGLKDAIDGKKMKGRHMEYRVCGCDLVEITW
jgi:hypothetical protein